MTMMKIGSVVRLKSGGPLMTVVGIQVSGTQAAQTPAQNNGGCPMCGPYPKMDSSEGAVMATIILAQQQWRTRHDAHVKFDSETTVQVTWMTNGEAREGHVPLEALVELPEIAGQQIAMGPMMPPPFYERGIEPVVNDDDELIGMRPRRRHRRRGGYRVRVEED